MRVIAIIGMLARKDASAFVAALAAGVADKLIAVPLYADHAPPDEIAAIARQHGVTARTALTLKAAMKNAARPPAPRVLVCGSFLLAAEALALENG
jgi:dihydrofolate synthase/folylpolyglutamate synthase